MPVLFVGHGSPMNAIENNAFASAWWELGRTLPKPAVILCVSAHWQSAGSFVHAGNNPKTIHDFGGFPTALYAAKYPCPGSPDTAKLVIETAKRAHVLPDLEWGLDHGAWSVLCRMYPNADIPVLELSMDFSKPSKFHFELGKMLRPLRGQGIMIVCSGNIVHNLAMLDWEDYRSYGWAKDFDSAVAAHIEKREFEPLVDYESMGEMARLSVPTPEHYWPLLYALGLADDNDDVSFPVTGMSLGSLSMRAVLFKPKK